MKKNAIETFGGSCPSCDSPLIQYKESKSDDLMYEACPTCSYANGQFNSNKAFPKTPKAISLYIWEKFLKSVGVDDFDDIRDWYQSEVDRYFLQTKDRTKDQFYPRLIDIHPQEVSSYRLKTELRFKTKNPIGIKINCTCSSLDLFHFGCKCGYFQREKLSS